MVHQKQIGAPYADKHGLRKVRVKQTFVNNPLGGVPPSKVTEVKYFLAECARRKANFTSFSSNGSGQDDIFRWIDILRDPELRQVGPDWATYVQFDRICALRL